MPLVLSPFLVTQDRWPERGRLASSSEWSRRTLAPAWNVPLHVATDVDYVGLVDRRWVRYKAALGLGDRLVHAGLLGFEYLLVPLRRSAAGVTGLLPPHRVAAADPELPAWLLELPHRPRAYLAREVSQASEDEALDFAVAGGVDGKSVVEGPVPEGLSPAAGDAAVEADRPGATVVRATPDRPALLVLNDAFAPGWTAEVDGRPAPIVRANALVRGVWLDAGVHRVTFRYRAPGLAEGWALALAGALGLGAWGLVRRRRGAGADPAFAPRPARGERDASVEP